MLVIDGLIKCWHLTSESNLIFLYCLGEEANGPLFENISNTDSEHPGNSEV